MKTSFIDFILCGASVLLTSFLSFFIVWKFITPYTSVFLVEFHILSDLLLFLLLYGLGSGIIVKTILLIKPIKLGEFSMEHSNFTYWKFLTITYRFGEIALKPFTNDVTLPLILKLFGAKIGKNAAIGGIIDNPYLITIGDNVIIGTGSLISGNSILNNKIYLGKIHIGNEVTIGVNTVIMPDTEMGNNSTLSIGSVLLTGVKVPIGENWKGNPARKWI